MSTQTRTDVHESRTNSPSSNSVVYVRNDGMTVAALILGALGMIFGLTAFSWAYIAERESRIVQGDVGFMRAYLNARGIEIPGSHEDAESE
jgi:hypothetical protein